MTIDQDLARIAVQEERLQFQSFDAETAWQLGGRLREAVAALGAFAAIDIQLAGQTLFFCAMPGATPDNAEWIRRKRSVVNLFQRSSYAVGLKLKRDATTLAESRGLDTRDYAPHGGCFPIRLRGSGCVGTITVSGLPQRQDHELVVRVLAEMLGQPPDELALGPAD